jgi:uncharacterized Zn finger protein
VTVRERRAQAARELAQLAKEGRKVAPVKIAGRKIAATFWGKAWCENLESYSDFANRLPRGRTYVRNGSVLDLEIGPGRIRALVSGSALYRIEIEIKPLARATWASIRRACAGRIGSMIELLQGRLSGAVMEIITHRSQGMFPAPREIAMECSCPDWAGLCKHLAAVLYGVGARLDHAPDLLFTLRQVDHCALIAQAADVRGILEPAADRKTIADGDLADVFGIELAETPVEAVRSPAAAAPARRSAGTRSRTRRRPKPAGRPGKRNRVRKAAAHPPGRAAGAAVKAPSRRGKPGAARRTPAAHKPPKN